MLIIYVTVTAYEFCDERMSQRLEGVGGGGGSKNIWRCP